VCRPPRTIPWLLVAAWATIIFIGSAQSGSTLPGGYSIQGHLGEYFVLGALLVWALNPDGDRRSAIVLAILLASLYGITDEFHQRFVVMRNPDVVDWMLDTIGATAGALTAAFVLSRAARKREQRADSPTD
jgi:VanZ family protein